ncbi:MAG: nicotinate (nicotinamide) nucleotide adenylyltransferase [Candidatus Coatesbacteria bacterium]|nr:nicotinate (nicotinamide) nucleotide adenylyltransferase [Candidatus Coatesbacteria bacterium]
MRTDSITRRKVGILGGTFDPVHNGHLIAAACVHEFLGLDRLLMIPCAIPPHKPNRAVASPRERLEMLEIATAGDPRLEASDIEAKRGGASYTIDTLRCLKSREPEDRFFLILGNDAFAEIATWKEYEALLQEVELVLMLRAGYARDEVLARMPAGLTRMIADAPCIEGPDGGQAALERGKKYYAVQVPQIGISGSMVRALVKERRSIRYLVPDAVMKYIDERGLYQ